MAVRYNNYKAHYVTRSGWELDMIFTEIFIIIIIDMYNSMLVACDYTENDVRAINYKLFLFNLLIAVAT